MNSITLMLQPSGNLEYAVRLCEKLARLSGAEVEQVIPSGVGTAITVSVPFGIASLLDWLRSQPEVVDAQEDKAPHSSQLWPVVSLRWPNYDQRASHEVIHVALRPSLAENCGFLQANGWNDL